MNDRLIFVFLFVMCLGSVYCHAQTQHRPNGWYHIKNGIRDSLAKEPIVTVKDFAELRLDSALSDNGRCFAYQIAGCVVQAKQKLWADETELAVGHSIGFVYEGEVICNPFVNDRIESGAFAISLSPSVKSGFPIKRIYQALRREAGLDN